MSYKKFSQYVSERELMEMAPTPQMQPTPANKAAVQNDLMAAQKTPPPPGTNPQDYQNKLKAAINVAKIAPVTSASGAVDVANAQSKIQQ